MAGASDDHRQGITAQSPIEYLAGVILFGGMFIAFSLIQAMSTRDAVLGFLQGHVAIPSGTSPLDVLKIVNNSYDHNMMIATAIAWSVQSVITWMSFPSDRAFLLAHRWHNFATTSSMSQTVELRSRMKTFLTWTLISLDVVTDMMFAAEGHTLVSGFSMKIIPLISDPGALIVTLMFPIAVCTITIFSGPEAFRRLDGLLVSIYNEYKRRKTEDY